MKYSVSTSPWEPRSNGTCTFVTIWYIAANGDEEVFDDPFRFDVTRSPNEHVAFGCEHHCLGASLARMEINPLFEELTKRVESVERIREVKRLRSNFINAIKHLPVRLTPSTQPAAPQGLGDGFF
jgi:cholest-4-en-3-one 26-monooxygenase